MVIQQSHVDLETPSGPMRTYVYRPVAEGRYGAIVFYSEIYQQTAPIARAAAMLAGNGLVVAVPEIYHEHEPAGTVLQYDTAGTERGNALKIAKPVQGWDDDCSVVFSWLSRQSFCNGKLG
ncbi:MAG: dienelactone hydrolase family protein, partial [Candidatus Xenobia bacterium]